MVVVKSSGCFTGLARVMRIEPSSGEVESVLLMLISVVSRHPMATKITCNLNLGLRIGDGIRFRFSVSYIFSDSNKTVKL